MTSNSALPWRTRVSGKRHERASRCGRPTTSVSTSGTLGSWRTTRRSTQRTRHVPEATGLRPPWTAMTATGTPWDPARLFVLWRPRAHLDGYVLTESGSLPVGHPGVVHGSSWQDVGVTWIGFERELATTGCVFDTQDLEQVSAERFARAVLGLTPTSEVATITSRSSPPRRRSTLAGRAMVWSCRSQRGKTGRSPGTLRACHSTLKSSTSAAMTR